MNWLNLALRVKDTEIRFHRAEGSIEDFRDALLSLKDEVDGELANLDGGSAPEALEYADAPADGAVPAPADSPIPPPAEERVAGYIAESWRSGV